MHVAHPAKHGLAVARFDLEGWIFGNKMAQDLLKLLAVTIHLRTDRHTYDGAVVGFRFAHRRSLFAISSLEFVLSQV
jgi:hypothetical protein